MKSALLLLPAFAGLAWCLGLSPESVTPVAERVTSFVLAEWWVPRWMCGYFPMWLIALYAVPQVWIWFSYERIPRQIRKLRKSGIVLLEPEQSAGFELFVKLCGRGHLLDGALAFFWPNYLAFAAWHLLTAIVSHKVAGSFGGLADKLLNHTQKQDIELQVERLESMNHVELLTGSLAELREEIHEATEAIRKIIE